MHVIVFDFAKVYAVFRMEVVWTFFPKKKKKIRYTGALLKLIKLRCQPQWSIEFKVCVKKKEKEV